jgi:hypothetical protein
VKVGSGDGPLMASKSPISRLAGAGQPTILDFSAQAYCLLCRTLSDSGYTGITLRDWIGEQSKDSLARKCAILRHDVDRFARNCLALARIEANVGFRASYYFRVPATCDTVVMRTVADLGHEIGLHYESLDKGRGDPHRARESFRKDLELVRSIARVDTIVAHGNPLTKWANHDLWKYASYDEFGILTDGYLSIDFSQFWYFTDTGRTWGGDGPNLKDTLPTGQREAPGKPNAKSTQQLAELITRSSVNLYIVTHPERWPDSWSGRVRSQLLDTAANTAKRGIRVLRSARPFRTWWATAR